MAVDHRPLQECVFVQQNLNEAGADAYLISPTHSITINAFMCLLALQRFNGVSFHSLTESHNVAENRNLPSLCGKPYWQIIGSPIYLCNIIVINFILEHFSKSTLQSASQKQQEYKMDTEKSQNCNKNKKKKYNNNLKEFKTFQRKLKLR